jgi:soluble lytic murein transglycosylase-like protein
MVLFSYSDIEEPDVDKKIEVDLGELGKGPNSPTSIKMYELIEKYSKKYDIPKHIAYNVSYKETRYGGPFDWDYNPEQESPVGAVGPMQIMTSTANHINDKNTDKYSLKTNIRLNIETSMKLLRKLYDKYGRWDLACGCYNTGKPMVNDYAIFCVTNKNYRKNWDNIK